jgi:hypothetical protein
MSTSAVSSSSLSQQLEQYFQTRRSDLQQLGQALAQGNLAGAQTAYNNIVQLGQNGPAANGDPFLIQSREQDFQAIGQALQSGDLAGAQQAFATLRNSAIQQAQSQDPTAGSTNSGAGPEIVLNLSGTSGSSPEQITININPEQGGGEQLQIGVGAQGTNPQQVTLNLAPNSNEEIVLNLLNPSSSTASTSATASGGLSVSA